MVDKKNKKNSRNNKNYDEDIITVTLEEDYEK